MFYKHMRAVAVRAAALVLVVTVGGVIGFLFGHRQKPNRVDGPHPVRVTVKGESDREVTIIVARSRTAGEGRRFWAVVRIHNVNGHSEYWPSKDLSAQPENYSYRFRVPDDADPRQPRSVLVYEVDEATAARLQFFKSNGLSPPIPERVRPPCDDCVASNEVDLPFS
ncbi:hypothetical protein Aab01nite_01450 [Paractinoplanes abujensis]|nr:hypothetical protein Aab01nite_01450 [Actinoplanes abujensis]